MENQPSCKGKMPLASKAARKSAPTIPCNTKQWKVVKRQITLDDSGRESYVDAGQSSYKVELFVLDADVFEGRTGVLSDIKPGDNTVWFVNADPKVFLTYVKCVYFGLDAEQLADPSEDSINQDDSHDSEQAAADDMFEKLVELFLLAEGLEDTQTSNLVMDEIVRFHTATKRVPMESAISLAYASTGPGHHLRYLLCATWLHHKSDAHCNELRKRKFPYDFVSDIAMNFFRTLLTKNCGRGWQWSLEELWAIDACSWHKHNNKNPICKPKDSFEASEAIAGDDDEKH